MGGRGRAAGGAVCGRTLSLHACDFGSQGEAFAAGWTEALYAGFGTGRFLRCARTVCACVRQTRVGRFPFPAVQKATGKRKKPSPYRPSLAARRSVNQQFLPSAALRACPCRSSAQSGGGRRALFLEEPGLGSWSHSWPGFND